jgi:hypothetical protein
MKGIEINEDFLSAIIGGKKVEEAPAEKIQEAKKEEEKVEEHICPLCESKLAEAISEEKLQEHVDYFLDVINENFEPEGESLDEEVDEKEAEETADDSAQG